MGFAVYTALTCGFLASLADISSTLLLQMRKLETWTRGNGSLVRGQEGAMNPSNWLLDPQRTSSRVSPGSEVQTLVYHSWFSQYGAEL